MVLSALAFAVMCLIGLQVIALITDTVFDASMALIHGWQAIVLMALWPGQRFWTITRSTSDGHHHSVIGVPTDDDLRRMHHRAAARCHRR